jgi:hypothetical protein
MEYIKENWGTILVFGLILFGMTRCVQNNIDQRERTSIRQEERRIEQKIKLEKRMLEAKPFIAMMEKYNPKNFDKIKRPKGSSNIYTIDIDNFFSELDQQYFVGTFLIEDVYRESDQKILLLSPASYMVSYLISGRGLYFKISCDMDISEITPREEILVIFTVESVLSSKKLEENLHPNDNLIATEIYGDCLAATVNFVGLEKLIEGN